MKILYVEDSPAAAVVMRHRLASFGHEVVHARDGREAIELFRRVDPDLVLMDIEMPGMNGFDAATEIRAIEAAHNGAWTPIIFLTASDTVENLITAIEAGGDDFMAKTVPEPVLHAKMKAMARIAALRGRLSQANLKLQELAGSDGLTGLFNRRSMDKRVDDSYAQAAALQYPYGLLMLDIDNFKKYNDFYGHQHGDECLRQVANAIRTAVENHAAANDAAAGAFVARYGGEEFAVVLPQVPDAVHADLARHIVQAVHGLALPHERNAEWGRVTISIGGAHLPCAGAPVFEMFRLADQRLYQAKELGRNRAALG